MYKKPEITTLDATEILESVGPASAVASGVGQAPDLLSPQATAGGSGLPLIPSRD